MTAVETVNAWARANGRRLAFLVGLGPRPAPGALLRLPVKAWAVLVAIMGGLCLALVLAGAPPAARAPVILTFLLLAPGWAVVRMLAIPDSAMRISVTFALSISIVGLVSLVQAYAGAWSPAMLVVACVVVTLLTVGIEFARARGGRR